MSTVINTSASDRTIKLGHVFAGIHGMADERGADMALSFQQGPATGLDVGFQASTSEIRAFAAELIRHADVTDAAHQRQVQEA